MWFCRHPECNNYRAMNALSRILREDLGGQSIYYRGRIPSGSPLEYNVWSWARNVMVKTLRSWRCQQCWVFCWKPCTTNRAGVQEKNHAGCKQLGHRDRDTRALESLHDGMLCSGFRPWDYRIQCLPFQILVLYWSILPYYFSALPFDMEMLTVPLCIRLYKLSLIL